jgi:hypothetical protein
MPGRFHLTGLTDDDIVVILWDMMAGGIDTSATSMVLPPSCGSSVAAIAP